MEEKISTNIINVLIWLLILLFFPLIAGTMNISEILKSIFVFVGSWSLGNLIIKNVRSFQEMSSFKKEGIAFFLGLFILSPIVFLTLSPILIASLLVVVILLNSYLNFKNFTFSFAYKDYLLLLVVLICLFPYYNSYDLLIRAVERYPTYPKDIPFWTDTDYFVSLVASIKMGTIYSSIFELGTAINYHFLGFVAPAFISGFTSTTSQVALYGMWIPFVSILSFIIISEIPLRFINKDGLVISIISILLYNLFQPIHNANILNDLPSTGIGFMGITSNIGSNVSILSALTLFLLFFPKINDEQNSTFIRLNFSESFLFILLISTLIIIKVPMFFCIGAFFGTILFFRLFKKEYYNFILLIIAVPLALFFYKISIQGDVNRIVTIEPGFFFNFIASITKISLVSFFSKIKVASVLLILIILWGSIRFLGITYLISSFNKNERLKYVSWATIITLVSTIILTNLISIKSITPSGGTIDISFDLLQFIRSSFLLTGIVGVIGILKIYFDLPHYNSAIIKYSFYTFLGLWCTLSLYGFCKNINGVNYSSEYSSWLVEVKKELSTETYDLLAIDPEDKYFSGILTASDLGQFWVAVAPGNGGYNFTTTNSYRWNVFKDLNSKDTIAQKNSLAIMKKEKVDIIIATFNTIDHFKELEKRGYILKKTNKNWLYYIP